MGILANPFLCENACQNVTDEATAAVDTEGVEGVVKMQSFLEANPAVADHCHDEPDDNGAPIKSINGTRRRILVQQKLIDHNIICSRR